MAKFLQRLALVAVLVGGATAFAASTAVAGPERPGARRRAPARRTFNLFAGATDLSLEVNRVYCGLTDAGNVCTDVTGSPVLGGGSWPRGTPDQYIFNTGVQLAGVIPASAGFAWAGDTVGAWAIDTRGPAEHMQTVTGLYNSLNANDMAAGVWPSAAFVQDTSIYHSSLIGRQSISQQDTWVRYWDGAPSLVTGRGHTMGVLVEQRSLAWNFPTGNEDLIYFVFRFTNITARASSGAYDSLQQKLGYSAQDVADIGALGDLFQNQSEAAFNVQIPDAGYTIGNMYVAFTADMDVGDATNNYATASLPFSLAVTWKSNWQEATWQFPANIFAPPFATAPGFVGVKYLKSPKNPNTPADPNDEFGMTIFSTYTNPSAANSLFPDPVNVFQGYRYVQGSASPAFGDNNSCQYPASRRLCFLTQAPSDQRTMQSSGPFSLAPGQSEVIVVAYMMSPAMLTNPGDPSYNLGPYIGLTTLLPGVVPAGDRLQQGSDTLRLVDRAMGWVSHNDINANGVIEQPRGLFGIPNEIVVASGSLLDKALVAQGVFDNKFLLPFAPDAPDFYLVPSNNKVTVVWAKSNTETTGDPYFAVASNPLSGALYDPNFRQFDVEGYRVWRGRSPATMEMVAQYDYAGAQSTITDFTGAFFNGDYLDATGQNRCAPELGVQGSCPVTFDVAPPFTAGHVIPLAVQGVAYPGAVQVVNCKPGSCPGRVQLADGTILITQADTAVTGGGSGFPGLTDNGVPFAYEDLTVRNGYVYYYSVTAFDVNSLVSGPSSLSSPLVTKSVTPRAGASTEEQAVLIAGMFGDDSVALDPTASWSIDPATGRFTAPPPPTDGIAAAFAPLVAQLLPAVSLTVTIDSLLVHSGADFACGAAENALGTCYEAFLTFTKDGVDTPTSVLYHHSVWSSFGAGDQRFDGPISLGNLAIPADSAAAARFGIPNGFAQFNATVEARFEEYIRMSVMEGQAARRAGSGGIPNMGGGANFSPGGTRWFDGTDEATGGVDHPGAGIRVGHLTGVDSVWSPVHHTDVDPGTAGAQIYGQSGAMQCFTYAMSGLSRQADVQVTWGAGGTIASVRDVTHRVPVMYKPNPQASYGFIGDANGDGVISFVDFTFMETVAQNGAYAGLGCGMTDPGPGARATLAQNPVIMAVSTNGATNPAPPSTGTGFGMYINGERFIFQLTGGTPPAAGTVWTLRSYAGMIRASSGGTSFTPSGYSLTSAIRPAIIPGLRIVFNVPAATAARTETAADLSNVHTVPDPYYVTNNTEITTNTKQLRFVNLPPQAIIRIYSASGILVNVITHNDAGLGGETTWDLRNRNNQFVASGVYFYHVETPTGKTAVKRFTVVNYAQ